MYSRKRKRLMLGQGFIWPTIYMTRLARDDHCLQPTTWRTAGGGINARKIRSTTLKH